MMENYQQALLNHFGYMVIATNEKLIKEKIIEELQSDEGVYKAKCVVLEETTYKDWEEQRIFIGKKPNSGWFMKNFLFYKVVAE